MAAQANRMQAAQAILGAAAAPPDAKNLAPGSLASSVQDAVGDELLEAGILFGVLRDSAYRLRRLAEQERERRTEQGKWD